MSTRQLDEPCWVLESDGSGRHFDDPDEARGWYDDGPAAECTRLSYRCIVITCDGLPGLPCGEKLTNEDEGWVTHCTDEQDARGAVAAEEWTVTDDGRWLCFDCREEAREAERALRHPAPHEASGAATGPPR